MVGEQQLVKTWFKEDTKMIIPEGNLHILFDL